MRSSAAFIITLLAVAATVALAECPFPAGLLLDDFITPERYNYRRENDIGCETTSVPRDATVVDADDVLAYTPAGDTTSYFYSLIGCAQCFDLNCYPSIMLRVKSNLPSALEVVLDTSPTDACRESNGDHTHFVTVALEKANEWTDSEIPLSQFGWSPAQLARGFAVVLRNLQPVDKVTLFVDEIKFTGGGCGGDGLTLCDDQCVVLSTDPEHCGECGNKCATGAPCVNGTCQGCPDGQDLCDLDPNDEFPGFCTDLSSDPIHCGGCFHECPLNSTCVNGTCVECPNHGERCPYCCGGCCSGVCCGSKCCRADQTCILSSGGAELCVDCLPPYTKCSDFFGCVDLQNNDSGQCGDCSTYCNDGEVCRNGVCTLSGTP